MSSVCFVVTELLGTVRNGGIGTATTHAALVLAREGYDVELLHCGNTWVLDDHWRRRYADAGVRVTVLDRTQGAIPTYVADSWRVYEQLRWAEPDVIVFQDWQGLGFCSMVAKDAGLGFVATRLIHICHGPYDWLREANQRLAADGAELAAAHMERRSAELADAVVGPSRHLVDWMEAAGWQLPKERHIIPYFTAGQLGSIDGPGPLTAWVPAPLQELVFFGRLEERKGVRIFCDALNRLGPARLGGRGVTFLGREATFSHDIVRSMIKPEVSSALRSLNFYSGLDQPEARAYLVQPGRTAVIPSLLDNSPNVVYECIEDRVSFLASDAGGTPELVAEHDRDRVLFAPTAPALAGMLDAVLAAGTTPRPPDPAFDGRASLTAWQPLLEPPAPAETTPAAADSPLVSVVIPHHDQPRLVVETIESIVAQDHPDIEIVVVDDGSVAQESTEALAAIEARDWGRPLEVIRQANLYLGAARNTGTRHATGDLIAFIDDDDLAEPHYVSTMVTALQSTGADAVTCAIRSVECDDDGVVPPDPDTGVWVFLGGDAVHLSTMFNTVGGAAMLVRREALEEVGGFHERHGVGHEDWDLLCRMVLAGRRLVAIPEAPYKYRVRPTSMLRTTSRLENMREVYAGYQRVLPSMLREWPQMLRSLQDAVEELQRTLIETQAEGQPSSWWRRDMALARAYWARGGALLVARQIVARGRRVTGMSGRSEGA